MYNFYLEFVNKLLEANMRYKINAPTFIYKILYGKDPDSYISGRSGAHQQYYWKNNVYIDKHIKRNYIELIDSIEGVELRASCEGSDENHPTFIIFRPLNQDEKYVKNLVNKLNKFNDIKSGYDRGMEGQFRIGVTTDLWYDKDPELFDKWWKELSGKIKRSL